MLEVSGLVRRFGAFTAVDGIGFEVKRGEVLGFLGPNGAGKSTTMKMITGFLGPTEGAVRIAGIDAIADPIAAKKKIGYLPEGAPAYPDMTPAGYLDFIAEVRGLSGADRRRRIAEVVERIELQRVMHQPIETLSKGFKRRVGLAQALLHDPEVLILDEPTDGLDPNQKHQVRNLIRELSPEKAIIISTHILEEVAAVCSRAMIIAHGRVVADGTPDELMARSRYHNAVVVQLSGETLPDFETIRDDVSKVPGVARVETEGDGRFIVFPEEGRAIADQVAQLARARGWELSSFHVDQGRLDEVFRTITIGGTGEQAA
ncbi:MAG: ABC transporter ATP-binding protein [Minwuia sp.]|uniref:ABC transporter ATP-binding protein n=1 Tax=Minwuia sp. TaxID=2493630 RepID=UPI003A89D8FA